ncbi:MAG TPA: S16 family serine protease, partial [Polyangia bacterium]|nr:S16 family serine protease [Polyangia bacterium]
GLGTEFYAGREIHIHVPAGAVPKDGPSAGVAMACSLVSLISGVPLRHDVAMTGELTLRGKVLPIGGLKEKLLAAARMGITTCIIPAGNAPELSEMPPHVMNKLTVKPVRTVDEALEIALTRRLDKKDADETSDVGASKSGSTKVGGRTRKTTRSGIA